MVGVDEVGRGSWAGPLLVVAARARPTAELPGGLKDSKLMTKIQRQKILELLSICCHFGEGWVIPAEIDELGLARAQRIGVTRALDSLGVDTDEEIIIDGKVNYVPAGYVNSSALAKADNLVPIVSAASIYAKVTRDKYMVELADKYPGYSFEKHVGYGTKLHAQALGSFGVINQVHRLSFLPIAKLAGAGI
jgi:ribonuclease HII